MSPTSSHFITNRRLEVGLLILAGLFIALNSLVLALVRGTLSWTDGLPLLVWTACAVGGTVWLNRVLPQRDTVMFPLTMFMTGWGLVAIDRLEPSFADRQVIWLIVGVGAMCLVTAIPDLFRRMRAYRYSLLTVGLVLLLATILFGVNPSGEILAPRLWLGIGSLYFQPSELLKIILVAFLASYLAEQYPALRARSLETQAGHVRLSPRLLGPLLLMWGLSVIVLIWQRDLGAAAIFFTLFLIMFYVASGFTPVLLLGGALLLIAGGAAYYLVDLVRIRIDIWLDPWSQAQGAAYQIVQSLMAVSAGGILGQGIGQGLPRAVPVAVSDFMFVALAEEWGLIGVTAVIGSLALLTSRGLRIALLHTGRAFHTLIAVGLSTILGVQSLLIMGGALKLIPLTGVTLPFFSYGGSSLLINFLLVGLLLRLSAGEPA